MARLLSNTTPHVLANRLDELEEKFLRMEHKLDRALSQQHKLFSELYSWKEEVEELLKEGK